MTYPLVLDLAAEPIPNPIALSCRVLGCCRQAFYAGRTDPVSQRDWDDAHVINAAHDVHGDDPQCGHRFITDEVERERGIDASENRVQGLCSQQRIAPWMGGARARASASGRRCATIWSSVIPPPVS